MPPLIVYASVVMALAILMESALAFLNLSDPNVASWGNLIGHGRGVLRTQWYVINADTKQAYRIGPDAYLVPSNDPVTSFDMINFGLQLRYRYEIAPLSDLYLVYSRGGIDRINNSDHSTFSLLGESTALKDADQVLFKLRYRF